MAKPIIEAEGISKSYRIGRRESYSSLRDEIMQTLAAPFRKRRSEDGQDQVWALRDVSFSVEEGEVLGIIGRNGAGKSTLLKILSRITEPTAGRIRMRGRLASLLEVGTGFHPELTGRENIFLNGSLLGMTGKEIRAKFDEIVAFSEIEKFLDTPVKRYSSGMYVRLAFAVAAHLEPEILVIDEVLAVGDAEFQKKCLGKMGDVARSGRTVLFVSHNMGAVRQLCNKACLLVSGQLAFKGGPAEAIARMQESSASEQSRTRNYNHIRGGDRARITKILVGGPNPDQASISIYDDIRIKMDFELKEETSEMEFFVLIYSSEGDVIASLFQRDSGENFKPVSKSGVVSLNFKNCLMPGKYFISAGIFDKGRQFLDWVDCAETFFVDQNFQDGRAYDQRLGRVGILGDWEYKN